jgi:hypothetical protein
LIRNLKELTLVREDRVGRITGGFIEGHLVKSFTDDGHELIRADIKPLKYWFQISKNTKNHEIDLKDYVS